MAIVLARVDDRLIHGQVVIGWGVPLRVDRIALVDDTVAASDWEQEIYRMALPRGCEVEFCNRAAAAARVRSWAADAHRVLILTGDVATMASLVARADGLIGRVNLGGIHAGAGRQERLRYLYLAPDEVAVLRQMESQGVVVTAQDVPTSRAVPLGDLL